MLFSNFKWIAGAAVVVALLAALGYVKHVVTENDTLKQTVTQQAKAAEHTAAVDKLNAHIDASASATAVATQTVYKTIDKEVIKYVAVHANNSCALDDGWLRIHNEAASGRVAASAGAANASQPATVANP